MPLPPLSYTWVPGREPALVFVHGLGADSRCFRAALDSPHLTGRAMLLPDLPGFGYTPVPREFPFTMSAHAESVCELAASVGAERIAIVSHSMGGAIGILLAETWAGTVTHFINAVGNLVSEDCTFSRAFLSLGRAAFESEGFARFKQAFRASPILPDRQPSTYYDSLGKTSARVVFSCAEDLVDLSDHGDLLKRFLDLPCRKLFLQDEDTPLPTHLEEALVGGGVPVEWVANSGHGLMEDNPDEFYMSIARFLA